MDARSEGVLSHVEPDLVKVLEAAMARGPQKFICIHGIRTKEEEAMLVHKGASQTMHSRHLPDKRGLAAAVDVAAVVEGTISWDAKLYTVIAQTVKEVAREMDIPVEWGGDWQTLKDLGHFQLPWAKYP